MMNKKNRAFEIINSSKIIYYENVSEYKLFFLKNLFPSTSFIRFQKNQSLKSNYLITWGSSLIDEDINHRLKIIRFEDGFIRSVGLGAGMISPSSWVFDLGGMYYDSSSNSDLFKLIYDCRLNTDDNNFKYITNIKNKIIKNDISKYNITSSDDIQISTKKKIILVIGQVEDDAAMINGGSFFKNNFNFIKAVRNRNIDSYIIYKPHPDTIYKLRKSDLESENFLNFVDLIYKDGDAISILSYVDEVHVITSLVGFEALIREKDVHCYGKPFYSNWGLTNDYSFDSDLGLIGVKSKGSNFVKKSIQELMYASLIEYPVYFSNNGKKITTIDNTIDRLIKLKSLKFTKYILIIRYKIYSLIKSFLKDD